MPGLKCHAIVVGIDRYDDKRQVLGAAVDDALAFARWVLVSGGVSPESLTLLLRRSGEEDTAAVRTVKLDLAEGARELPFEPATADGIRRVITKYQKGRGRGADRLYFYFAGHGSSAPKAVLGKGEPVLVPGDVNDLADDGYKLLGFSSVLTALGDADPPEQVFFIDACRDYALEQYEPTGVGSGVGRWVGPNAKGGRERARQYVIYSTSPGEKAVEQRGRGVMAELLMNALAGSVSTALTWSEQSQRWELLVGSLHRFLQERIQERAKRELPADWQKSVQLPWLDAPGWAPEAVIASFADAPPAGLKVDIDADKPPARATVFVSFRTRGRRALIERQEIEGSIAQLWLPPNSFYEVTVSAAGHKDATNPVYLSGGALLTMKLEPADGGLEAATRAPEFQFTAPREDALRPGSVLARTGDPGAVVDVLDAWSRSVVVTGIGTALAKPVNPGHYVARLHLPEGLAPEELVEVAPGGSTVADLDCPEPELGYGQLLMLAATGIHLDEHNHVVVAEGIALARPRLGSLLAFAAYAAQCAAPGSMPALAGAGALGAPGHAESALLLFVGADGESPGAELSVDDFIAFSWVVVRRYDGAELYRGALSRLAGWPAAAELALAVPPGPLEIELRIPGTAPSSYNGLVVQRGRVLVLTFVVGDDGGLDVQQYILPLAPDAQLTTSNLRRAEAAQRYHGARVELPRALVDQILAEGPVEPIASLVAGYTLARARSDEFKTWAARLAESFPDLPDVHVLAAAAAPPGKEDAHLREAAQGIPLFGDGYLELSRWRDFNSSPAARYAAGNALAGGHAAPPALRPGAVWTSWMVDQPILAVHAGTFGEPPRSWSIVEGKRSMLEEALLATGRFKIAGSPAWLEETLRSTGQSDHIYPGTGFVVGDGLVLTTSDVLRMVAEPIEGAYRLQADARLQFVCDEGDGTKPSFEGEVKEILAVDFLIEARALVDGYPFKVFPMTSIQDLPAGLDRGAVGLALLRVDTLGKPWPKALRLAKVPPPGAPLGKRLCALGYPQLDRRYPGLSAPFKDRLKWLSPGTTAHIDGPIIFHDCRTSNGSSGSPVVDLETGLVAGIQVQGFQWHERKYGGAFAVWEARDRHSLRDL
jgi:uncharacterized caspase-like protein